MDNYTTPSVGNNREVTIKDRVETTTQTSDRPIQNNPVEKDGRFEEEYYELSEANNDESALNTASGILAITLIALAVYLVWAVLN